MAYYKLIRMPADGKVIRGTLFRTGHYFNHRTQQYTEVLHPICDTLEDADSLIPALVYAIGVTRSSKFNRLLPVIRQVPDRTDIRFHRGTHPVHSKGCILITPAMEQELTSVWLAEQTAREETRLEIADASDSNFNH